MPIQLLSREHGVYLSKTTVEKILKLSADALKLYLYLSVQSTLPSADVICNTLGFTQQNLQEAEIELMNTGLAHIAEEAVPAPEVNQGCGLPPKYSVDEIATVKTNDSGFSSVVTEVERLIKPFLNTSELRELLTVYSYYGMPADVVITLVHFVSQRNNIFSNGSGKASFGIFKKEAYQWIEKGILSASAAEMYVLKELDNCRRIVAIEHLPGIKVTYPGERTCIRNWFEMGFDTEAIKLSADISMKRRGEAIISYMDAVLKGWKRAGLTSFEDITMHENKVNLEIEKKRYSAAKRNANKDQYAQGALTQREQDVLNSLLSEGE